MTTPSLSHRERMERTLSGQAVDRPPVALWRHFPVDDQTPDGLAAAVAQFQALYDFDFIKVTPASSFCIKDWGVKDEWRGNPEGVRDYTAPAIRNPEDWARLPFLPPTRGHLGAQLECLRLLRKSVGSYTPILQTIFSPLAQAKNLVGKANLQVHIRKYPAEVHAGLEEITRTTIAFLEAAIQTGIDGVFYAIQHAQYALVSDLEFEEFGRSYDLQVLRAAQSLWLNMAHIHGSDILFETVRHYPVQILNWHDQETAPDLASAQNLFSGTVCGGLRQWETLVNGNPEQVRKEAAAALLATSGKRFVLGTGCVVPVTAPHSNLLAARQSVEKGAA